MGDATHDDLEASLKGARTLLMNTWKQGRRVLVVLGAGASAAAGIPRMPEVFSALQRAIDDQLRDLKENSPRKVSQVEETVLLSRIDELREWLVSLSRGGAPRSIAAMALGMMQRAHESASQGLLPDLLHRAWMSFSNDFIANVARKTQPTKAHRLVAKWALKGGADIISVNFDGLTHRALQKLLDETSTNGSAVVLSEPREISKYFLGDHTAGTFPGTLLPVIKIWGDVFHAVCTNTQCPQSGIRAPIFRLWDESKEREFQGAPCPDCRSPRQLQIFFAGYEEKEKSALASMSELLKFVAPRVGCIVTIGFSGLWDHALVTFLATVCADLDKERVWRSKLVKAQDRGDVANQQSSFWINVDWDSRPPLLQDLASFGIAPVHLHMAAEDFADKAPDFLEFAGGETELFKSTGFLEEGKWDSVVREKKCCPMAYKILVEEATTTHPSYLADFELLRQLGLKTRIASATSRSTDLEKKEANHNRRRHSFGAAHLAMLWFRKLVERGDITLSKGNIERFATVALFSAVHHDIGHLPFTHLAEDILSEVHWNIDDWSSEFHHDVAVLANCYDGFRERMFKVTESAAKIIKARPGEFRIWVECAIQARSGCNWVDAILNSPLDTDKLDYVLRDCDYLRQGIHVPIETTEESYRWLDIVFSNTRLLPSGLLALEGTAGEYARDFLEERRWLYKHQYHQAGFRALERLAGAVILHWLLSKVPESIIRGDQYQSFTSDFGVSIGDTSALKGRVARQLLWKGLKGMDLRGILSSADISNPNRGEPELLMEICADLCVAPKSQTGLPSHPGLQAWARRCLQIFENVFHHWHSARFEGGTLLQHLTMQAGLTCSETVYVPVNNLREVRELIRQLETLHPFRALFDVAVEPRMLSYPERRRLHFGSSDVIGECFAVSHRDPDRWGIPTANWIPLAETAFAERDRKRWSKIMVISAEPNDPLVPHALDRFTHLCGQEGIIVREVDPGGESR